MGKNLESWWGQFEWAPVLGVTPALVLGGLAILLAFWISLSSRVLKPGWRRVLVGLFRFLFIVVLVVLLWNPVRKDEVKKEPGATVFLVDRSRSMGLGEESRLAKARAWSERVGRRMDEVSFFSFADDVRADDLEELKVEGGPTFLAAALQRAGEEAGSEGQVVVVSDGCGHDRRELPLVLKELDSRGVKVYGKVVGENDPVGNAWLADLRVARMAKPGQSLPIEVTVGMDGLNDRRGMLRLRNGKGELVQEEEVALEGGKFGMRMEMVTGLRTENWELALEEVEGDRREEDNRVLFSVKVSDPKLKVLYLEGTHAMRLVTSDEQSGWWNECEIKTRSWDAAGDIEWSLFTPLSQYAREENLYRVKGFADGRFVFDQSRAFPKTRKELFEYDVVICGDIPQGNFSKEQMDWLVELVTNRGGGFCMIGGYTSFDSGAYDQTPIEKITPVDILYHGYGYNNAVMSMVIPETARKHPIWRISEDEKENENILALHPLFLGYHDIQRAKPGATILGLREDGEGPLIAVQKYGKGRSMAFLSDTNGGWARTYVTWQNPNNLASTEGSHRELGHGVDILYKAHDVEGLGPAQTPHPCEYVGKFWVNVVRWLGEKSQRLGEQDLLLRSEMVVVERGGKIKLSAEILAPIEPALLADVSVRASLVGQIREEPLLWNRERREFVGELKVPEMEKGSVVEVAVVAEAEGLEFRDQIKVGLLEVDPELLETDPDDELMSDIVQATGGMVLTSPKEASEVLEEARREVAEARVSFRRPVWGRWEIFLLLVGLLGLEWLLRRMLAR